MNYRISENGGVVQVSLDGSLNFSCNEDFQGLLQKLMQSASKRVEFNMSGVASMDSVGLGLLYIAQEDLSGNGAKLSITNPSENVRRLLELTQSNLVFDVR
ncbi:MAG TPA: STAS domain-containing protein [Candidatus Sulfotelmatobacter sp.]|nr:STAS domain-containing protein [Candidatus Sulfotelmatobacter sp.]